MPSKKKKYNARFPAVSSCQMYQFTYLMHQFKTSFIQGRIKKIMQTDEEVGKVAQAVPVIIYILFFK